MEKPKFNDFPMLSPLTIQRYERYLPTAFDESMSLLEKSNKIIEFLNHVERLLGNFKTDWETFATYMIDYMENYEEVVDKRQSDFIEYWTDFSNKVYGGVLIWLEPVNTFAELSTKYPNAVEGNSAMVVNSPDGLSKVYRFTNGVWKVIQSFDGSAMNEIDNRLTGSLNTMNTKLTENTTKLNETVINLSRPRKLGTIKLPSDFPKIPFNVIQTRSGYRHDFDFTKYEYSKKIYVSGTGTTSNDGLTPETPTRNVADITSILAGLSETNVTIVMLDKFFSSVHWGNESFNFNKNIRIASAHSGGTTIGNFAVAPWESDGELFKMARTAVGVVLFYDKKDEFGKPAESYKASSLLECQNTPYSWFTDGVNIWVNKPNETLATVRENVGVLYRVNLPLRFMINNTTLYFDNVGFAREANKSKTYEAVRVTGNAQSTVIARRLQADYGDRNGFETLNVGYTHLFDCVARKNLIDGFNYHGVGTEVVTEFNCYASDNGTSEEGSANATTAHDGMSIFRVGTVGERCYGPVLADVNGCYSYNVGCAMYDTMNPDSASYFFSDTGGSKKSNVTLIDCDGESPLGFGLTANMTDPIKVRNLRVDTVNSNVTLQQI